MLLCHKMSHMTFIFNWENYKLCNACACTTNEESDQGVVPWCWNGSSHCNPESSKGQKTGLDVDLPRAIRTKIVEATAATPALAIIPLHAVPVVQTHLASTSGRYWFCPAFVAITLFAGTGLQSVGTSLLFSTLPYWQYSRPDFKFLYFRYATRVGFDSTGYNWFSHWPMLVATSSPKGAKANQPRKARKKEMVAAQNARMYGFCCTLPHTHAGVAIPWLCCSHPLPIWSPTCWNLQSSDYCDSHCNFYCAKWLPQAKPRFQKQFFIFDYFMIIVFIHFLMVHTSFQPIITIWYHL